MKTHMFAVLVLLGMTLALTTSASAQAPPTPITATRTSIPGHPLRVLFGEEPRSLVSFARPNTAGLPHYDSAPSVRSVLGNTVPTTIRGYQVKSVGADAGEGRFQAEVWFETPDGGRMLRLRAWTKTGEFVITANPNSPVTEVIQSNIGGLAALTFLPTAAVAGGNGPRTVYLTDGQTIWVLEIEGFTDNAAAMQLVETVVRIVTAPGAPSTGTSLNAAGPDSPNRTLYLLLGGTLVAFAAATWLQIRQR